MATTTNTKTHPTTTDTQALLAGLSATDLHHYLGSATVISDGTEHELSVVRQLEQRTGPADATIGLYTMLNAAHTAAALVVQLAVAELDARTAERKAAGSADIEDC